MDQLHPNKVRQFLFLAIIILLFWVIWSQMYFMLGAFFGAITLYVIARKWMFKMIIDAKWPRWLVALIIMIISLVVIVLPFAWIITMLINKIQPYIVDKRPLFLMMGRIDVYLQSNFKLDVFTKENVEKAIGTATSLAPKILGSTLVTVSNLGIMYFILYFMIVKCNDMELWLRRNLPLQNRNSEKLLAEIREMVKANAIGIPVLAIVQGIVAMIGYMIFGVDDPVLWGIITGICSVVPLVGTMLAWVPITLYLFASGDQGGGIGLLLWGLLVIGTSDNVFRFILAKKLADVHPLITVFGVIIGVNLFGFMGLIFGPLLLSVFALFVRIYIDEFGKKRDTTDN
ncbi:MAG: AI-2E family transporter [Bacteroidota bacterium]